MDENSKLYCLEAARDASQNQSKVLPLLEHLAMEHDITNVHQSCDDIASFEQSLNDLLYEDKNFKSYEVIYLAVGGTGNHIEIQGYKYSLEEIAELFEGKLSKKVIHFSNTKTLDIDLETAQYFLDVTGAKALSGYTEDSFLDSLFLDSKLFGYYFNDTDDVAELVRLLLENHNAACRALGFRLFY